VSLLRNRDRRLGVAELSRHVAHLQLRIEFVREANSYRRV
jgi:hypothetical protein